MKYNKFLALIVLVLCFAFSTFSVSAGEICGEVLNSDIITYINNFAVPTYVVNGTSVVVAEDLRNFGFDVVWDGEARTLSITRNNEIEIFPGPFYKTVKPIGSKFCDLYTTDIMTYAYDVPVTSYNINGYTMIPVEELTMLGEVQWYESERILKMTVPGVAASPVLTGAYYRVFSPDGTGKDVAPTELEFYRQSGWSTAEDLVNRKIETLVSQNGYASTVSTMEATLEGLTDVFFREAYKTGLENLYSQWYAENKAPVAIVGCYIDFDTGYPRVNMTFRNIGGKKVTSFKVGFEFTDYKQEIIPDSVTVATSKKVMNYTETTSGRWTIKKFLDAAGIIKPEIIRVEFEDGTAWEKPEM